MVRVCKFDVLFCIMISKGPIVSSNHALEDDKQWPTLEEKVTLGAHM
jgi:hypothetical protein